jgi:hypothetical protein
MTNIKGFALVLVGILIFSGSCIYASDQYENPTAQESTELEDRAWDLMRQIRESDSLLTDAGAAGVFDAKKVKSVQAQDMALEGLGSLQFQLEIIDVHDHGVAYSRSIAYSNSIQTANPPSVVEEGKLVTIHSAVTVFVRPDEIHGAQLVLRVWEA